MKFKIEKNIRILDELLTYFTKLGNTKLNIEMNEVDNKHYFLIKGAVENISEDELNHLKKTLNTQRQHEIEEYYWQLGGEVCFDCELTLVGMMIDSAKIEYDKGILTIEIIRED